MVDLKAIHYGQVEIIPGLKVDGYVLDDGTAVLSDRGTADLVGMNHSAFQRVAPNWPPKALKDFIANDFIVAPKLIMVITKNSPYYTVEHEVKSEFLVITLQF